MANDMSPAGTSPDSDPEFEALLKRIGHPLSPDRRRGLYLVYADAKRQAAALRKQPLPAALEPSNTFSLLSDLPSCKSRG